MILCVAAVAFAALVIVVILVAIVIVVVSGIGDSEPSTPAPAGAGGPTARPAILLTADPDTVPETATDDGSEVGDLATPLPDGDGGAAAAAVKKVKPPRRIDVEALDLLLAVVASFERSVQKSCQQAGSVLELSTVLPLLSSIVVREAKRPLPVEATNVPDASTDVGLLQLAEKCSTTG